MIGAKILEGVKLTPPPPPSPFTKFVVDLSSFINNKESEKLE